MADREGDEGESSQTEGRQATGWAAGPRSPGAFSLHKALGKEKGKETAATTTGLVPTCLQTPPAPHAPNLGEAPETGHFLIEYDINYRVHH